MNDIKGSSNGREEPSREIYPNYIIQTQKSTDKDSQECGKVSNMTDGLINIED